MAIDWTRLNRRFNLTSSIVFDSMIGDVLAAREADQTNYDQYACSVVSCHMEADTKWTPYGGKLIF